MENNVRIQMPTERGKYRFTVKEGAEGQPFLMAEDGGEQIATFTDLRASFGLELRRGITVEEAREIAHKINEWVTGVALWYSLPPEISLSGDWPPRGTKPRMDGSAA
jgi:hypothetical protein